MDPKTIYFSLATLNDALPVLDASTMPTKEDLVIHEDDWRQLEAVSRTLDMQIEEEVADVRRILKEKSTVSGAIRIFSEIHVRKRISRPLPTPIAWNELLDACGVQPASVRGVGLRDGQGTIPGGFAFQIAQSWIYGIRQEDQVIALCFEPYSAPGLGDAEARRLADFLGKSKVLIVHWPSGTAVRCKEAVIDVLKQKSW